MAVWSIPMPMSSLTSRVMPDCVARCSSVCPESLFNANRKEEEEEVSNALGNINESAKLINNKQYLL